MSEDEIQETSSIHDLAERGREKLTRAQAGATDALSVVVDYARANPWVALAGAAILGGVVVAVAQSGKSESRGEIVRSWLDEAYAKLPSQRQVQSVVERSGVPDFFAELRKKLHLG